MPAREQPLSTANVKADQGRHPCGPTRAGSRNTRLLGIEPGTHGFPWRDKSLPNQVCACSRDAHPPEYCPTASKSVCSPTACPCACIRRLRPFPSFPLDPSSRPSVTSGSEAYVILYTSYPPPSPSVRPRLSFRAPALASRSSSSSLLRTRARLSLLRSPSPLALYCCLVAPTRAATTVLRPPGLHLSASQGCFLRLTKAATYIGA